MRTYRISFLAGLATGFVLGARAGRERYNQIVQTARTVAEHPAVQQAAGAVQAQASDLATTATNKLGDRMPQLAKKVQERVPGVRPRNGTTAPASTDGPTFTTSGSNGTS